MLPQLGYSQEDWYQEVALGRIRLDFLAFAAQVLPFTLGAASSLSLVIEAKSPRENLNSHARRLKQYLSKLSVKHGLLTNGKELRIYEMQDFKNVPVIFQCSGDEIEGKIDDIRSIVGRSNLQKNQLNLKKKNSIPTKELEKEMKVIAVYHNKGGVGKTTVSVNLAAALRRKGYNVLLVDIDSQANSTFAAGLVKFQFEEDDDLKDKNIFHVLKSADFDSIQDVARSSSSFNTPEIDVIPAHIDLIERQFDLNRIKASQTRLIKKLKKVEKDYDFAIIDTPPSRDMYAQIAMISAQHLIIPSDLKPFANQGLRSVRELIKEVDDFRDALNISPINVLGVLPSKISTNTRAFKNTFPKQKATILERYKFPVLDTVIFDRVALSHCLNKTIIVGDLEIPDPKSIFDFADKDTSGNKSAEEFEILAEEILLKVA